MNDEPRSGEYIPRQGTSQGGPWGGPRAQVIRMPFFSTLGFGSMLAISISYFHNQSIAWAVVHGLLSWLFVIYAALFYE